MACQGEWQLKMCGDIALDKAADLAACCARYRDGPPAAHHPPTAAAMARPKSGGGDNDDDDDDDAAVELGAPPRPDLDDAAGPYSVAPDFLYGRCTKRLAVKLPVFSRAGGGNTTVAVEEQAVPELNPAVIAAVKARALSRADAATRRGVHELRRSAEGAGRGSGGRRRRQLLGRERPVFEQPGAGYVSALELARMRGKARERAPLQAAAVSRLLHAAPDSKYGIDIPVGARPRGYGGPYPMKTFQADYCERMFGVGGRGW